MTKEEIDEALKLCEAATPGPWKAIAPRKEAADLWISDEHLHAFKIDNAAFIASARELLPKALRALSAANEDVEAQIFQIERLEKLNTEWANRLEVADAALAKANEDHTNVAWNKQFDAFRDEALKSRETIKELTQNWEVARNEWEWCQGKYLEYQKENEVLRSVAVAAEKILETELVNDYAGLGEKLSAWRNLTAKGE